MSTKITPPNVSKFDSRRGPRSLFDQLKKGGAEIARQKKTGPEDVKNPLRQLASIIKDACQKDGASGVKFTTILKAVSSYKGFRSIQCSDAAAVNGLQDTTSITTGEQSFVQRYFFFCAYPMSDVFGVDFEFIEGRPLTRDDIQDPIFVVMWNALISDPSSFMTFLESFRTDVYVAQIDSSCVDVEPVLAAISEMALPDDIKRFFTSEVTEQMEPGSIARDIFRSSHGAIVDSIDFVISTMTRDDYIVGLCSRDS